MTRTGVTARSLPLRATVLGLLAGAVLAAVLLTIVTTADANATKLALDGGVAQELVLDAAPTEQSTLPRK